MKLSLSSFDFGQDSPQLRVDSQTKTEYEYLERFLSEKKVERKNWIKFEVIFVKQIIFIYFIEVEIATEIE